MTEALFIFVGVGLAAGVLAGLLGIGGGLVIVPALAFVLPRIGVDPVLAMHMAVATSLCSILFTGSASVWAHHRRGAVLWPVVMRMAPGIALGALLMTLLADQLSSLMLTRIFGVFALMVAAEMLIGRPPKSHRNLPGGVAQSFVGLLIGAVSSLVGIGGGSLTVPFLSWCNIVIQRAVATASACGLPIALGGTLGYVLMGLDEVGRPDWALGYVYLPALAGIVVASVPAAPLGAALAHRLPRAALKRVFGIFVLVLGIYLLLKTP